MKTSIKSITTGALGTAAWLVVSTGNAQPQDRPQPGNFDPQQMRQRMTERMREQFDVTDDAEWKAISERIDKVMQARRAVGGADGPGGLGFPGGQAIQDRRGAPDGQDVPGGPPPQGDQRRPDGFRFQGGRDGQGGPGGPGGQGGPGRPLPQGGQPRPDGFGLPGDGPQRPPAEFQRPDGFRNGLVGPGGTRGFVRETNPELDALRKAIENEASAAEIKSKLADLRAARKKKEAKLEKAQNELRKSLSPRQEAVAVTLGLLK